VLVTGPKSRAEVDLGSGSPGGASIKLAENTAFYFDTEELSEAQRKTYRGSESFQVRTEESPTVSGEAFALGMVARDGLEPPTREFSVSSQLQVRHPFVKIHHRMTTVGAASSS